MIYLCGALYVLGAGMTVLFLSLLDAAQVELKGYGLERIGIVLSTLLWPPFALGMLVLTVRDWLNETSDLPARHEQRARELERLR